MNPKVLRGLIALVAIGVLVLLLNILKTPVATIMTPGTTVAAQGTVTLIDLEQVAFDGPARLELETADGSVVKVNVPSMGIQLCPAYQSKNIGDVYAMRLGLELEVKGIVGEDGAITPCEVADHYLRSVPLTVDGFEGEADPTVMSLTMKPWTWISAQYNDGRKAEPMRPGDFTVTFDGAGRFSARTDCNSMSGSYTAGKDGVISFSQIVSTKMFCQGSQEAVFAALLTDATTYTFTSRGELILGLKFDSGTVTFK